MSGLWDLCSVPRFTRAPRWSPARGVRSLCVQGCSCWLGLVPGVLGSVGRSRVLEGGGPVGVCPQQLLIGCKLKVTGVGPRTGGSRERLCSCLRVWGWEGGGSMRSSPGHQKTGARARKNKVQRRGSLLLEGLSPRGQRVCSRSDQRAEHSGDWRPVPRCPVGTGQTSRSSGDSRGTAVLSTRWPFSACGPVHLPASGGRSVHSSGPLGVTEEQPLTTGHWPRLWAGRVL